MLKYLIYILGIWIGANALSYFTNSPEKYDEILQYFLGCVILFELCTNKKLKE